MTEDFHIQEMWEWGDVRVVYNFKRAKAYVQRRHKGGRWTRVATYNPAKKLWQDFHHDFGNLAVFILGEFIRKSAERRRWT